MWITGSRNPQQVVQVITLTWKAARKIIIGMGEKLAAIWHAVEISV
jgi:hypothetical protein